MEIFEKIHNTSVEEFIASISADSRDDRLKNIWIKFIRTNLGMG